MKLESDILRSLLCSTGHIGVEIEGMVASSRDHRIVHQIDDVPAIEALRKWISDLFRKERDFDINRVAAYEVLQTMVEANPGPYGSPRAAAMAKRLHVMLLDAACCDIGEKCGAPLYLHQGVPWKPPRPDDEHITSTGSLFKDLYLAYQARRYREGIAVTGDHLHLSAPWVNIESFVRMDFERVLSGEQSLDDAHDEVSSINLKMAGMMRLLGSALSIALSASSPLHYRQEENGSVSSILASDDSVRLARIFPTADRKDQPELFKDMGSMRRLLSACFDDGRLIMGGDIYTPVRLQGLIRFPERRFEDVCKGMDPDRVSALLGSSFTHGSLNNPHHGDSNWHSIEAWRRELAQSFIYGPKSHLEMRTFESPLPHPDFTSYEWEKALVSFFEVLFVWISQDPEAIAGMEYGVEELEASKQNEKVAAHSGLDSEFVWIPDGSKISGRAMLLRLLDGMEEIANQMSRVEDMDLLRLLTGGDVLPPGAQVRKEASAFYNVSGDRSGDVRLPHDGFYAGLIRRRRSGFQTELEQISSEFSSLGPWDQYCLRPVFHAVHSLY